MTTEICQPENMSTNTTTVGVVNGHTHSSPYGYTPSAAANITFLVTLTYDFYWLTDKQKPYLGPFRLGIEIPYVVF